jgi:hypothetical protein
MRGQQRFAGCAGGRGSAFPITMKQCENAASAASMIAWPKRSHEKSSD